MPSVKCTTCATKFYAKPNWIKKGWGKYCSRKCHSNSQRKGRTVKCFTCGVEVYRSPKQLNASQSEKYFCTKSCQTNWRNSIVFIGNRHPQWKNGESSYRNIIR